MPFTIELSQLPIGFTVSSARPGETVAVNVCGFVTSEDGAGLAELLTQVSEGWLSRLPKPPRESSIDHIVIVFRRDCTAQVFVNEVTMQATVAIKAMRVQAGEAVDLDKIADAHRLTLQGVDVPPDAGVLVMLSARWRRALLFDFGPLTPGGEQRVAGELEQMLASVWTYLQFQDRLNLSDSDWAALQASGWFPFIGLPTRRIKEMRDHARAGWNVDDLVPTIVADVRGNLPRLRDQIETGSLFEGHRTVLLKALTHFEARDDVTVAAMLYPRIEGLLRTQHARHKPSEKATQDALAGSAVAEAIRTRHEWSLMLPSRFETYLRNVYFAHFSPAVPTGVNRNTVGHGVAPEADLDAKASAIALLIVEQLAFMCSGTAPP